MQKMVIAGEKNLTRKEEISQADSGGELARVRGELDRARRVLDTAVLLAGSEFIKPLSSIKGYLGLLKGSLEGEEGSGSRREHYFLRAEEAIYDLEQLIHLYMQLLRSSQGKPEPGDIRSVKIRDLVEEVIEKYCKEPGVIMNEVDRKLGGVSVQRNPLAVVLGNIFSAAVKSGCLSSASVTARVWAESEGKEKGFLIIDLICPARAKEIEYYPVKPDEPGILLARNIIEILGGKLEENRVRGKGCTLTLYFPAMVESLTERRTGASLGE
ncbi:MAG: hypothetical protein GF417_04615 [Candidatus Latescibacteria bacterium]|nr:hypothetical protein [bacterium]MBD3423705.1 hypothetical protein [Candidatus Latescibacterota bacterium]